MNTQDNTTGKKDSPNNDGEIAKFIKKADQDRQNAVDASIRNYQRILCRYKEKPPQDITPFMVIRHLHYDTPTPLERMLELGLRPIPAYVPFWISPDITIESSSPVGNPVAGEENFIHVKIHNFGDFDSAPVRIDFFWGDPSLGLGPANLNYIGTEHKQVKSYKNTAHPKDIRCNTPWVPATSGHYCIVVNCTNPILDWATHPSEPVLDRHCGQKNFHVDDAVAEQAFKFTLNFNNFFQLPLANHITAKFDRLMVRNAPANLPIANLINMAVAFKATSPETMGLTNLMGPDAPQFNIANRLRKLTIKHSEEREQPVKFEEVHTSAAGPVLRSRVTDYSKFVFQKNAERTFGERLLANTQIIRKTDTEQGKPPHSIHSLEMKPFEQKKLEVELVIPKDAKRGEIMLLHLVQQTDTLILGGFTCAFHIIK